MSKLYNISVTHPTTCSNGSITIDGPTSSAISYTLNGGAESTPSAALPIVVGNLAPGTHGLEIKTADLVNFHTPVVLSSAYVLSVSSLWFWFWAIVVVAIVAAIVWATWTRVARK